MLIKNFLRVKSIRLKKKDTIKMTVSQVLNGTYTEEGDEFFAEITEDVLGGKRNKGIIVPKGSIVHGYVSAIEDPKNLGRDGYIVTVFDYLVTPDGRQIPIQASLSTKENVVKRDSEGGGKARWNCNGRRCRGWIFCIKYARA